MLDAIFKVSSVNKMASFEQVLKRRVIKLAVHRISLLSVTYLQVVSPFWIRITPIKVLERINHKRKRKENL